MLHMPCLADEWLFVLVCAQRRGVYTLDINKIALHCSARVSALLVSILVAWYGQGVCARAVVLGEEGENINRQITA